MQYIKEDVEVILKEHLKDEAKKTEANLKIEEYQTRLDYAGLIHIEDNEDEVIEAMQLSSSTEAMVKTNRISDKTSKTAMNYRSEMLHVNKEDRSFLENKIIELKCLRNELDKKIVRVKNMINHLSCEERFVIETYYMEKAKWDYVEKRYFDEYEKHKSINQLLNIRDNAIRSMLEVINIGE